jgi:hypothetical protein
MYGFVKKQYMPGMGVMVIPRQDFEHIEKKLQATGTNFLSILFKYDNTVYA